MANDWVKMRTMLARDPKVIRMADQLAGRREFIDAILAPVSDPKASAYCHVTRHVTRALCVAGLLDVWGTARERGKRVDDDLVLEHSTLSTLDALAALPAFGEAMALVGWAREQPGPSVVLPNFFADQELPDDTRRANDRERQARCRGKKKDKPRPKRSRDRHVTVTPESQGGHVTCHTREEKSREEDKPPLNPPSGEGKGGEPKAPGKPESTEPTNATLDGMGMLSGPARQVVALYAEKVRSPWGVGGGTNAVRAALVAGGAVADMERAVAHYAAHVAASPRCQEDRDRIKSVAHFFANDYWVDFIAPPAAREPDRPPPVETLEQKRERTARERQARKEAAGVVAEYEKLIGTPHRDRGDGAKAVAAILSGGRRVGDLLAAAKEYARECEGDDPKFRRGAAKFYSGDWAAYLPLPPKPPVSASEDFFQTSWGMKRCEPPPEPAGGWAEADSVLAAYASATGTTAATLPVSRYAVTAALNAGADRADLVAAARRYGEFAPAMVRNGESPVCAAAFFDGNFWMRFADAGIG